jgi:hypothetical protein
VIAFGQPAVIAIFTLLSRIWSVITGGSWSDPPPIPGWLALTVPVDHYQRSTVLSTRMALKEQATTLAFQRHPMADRFAEEVCNHHAAERVSSFVKYVHHRRSFDIEQQQRHESHFKSYWLSSCFK